jgi:hypothetical protein
MLAVTTVNGCSSDSDSVASLGRPAAQEPAQPQGEAAMTMVECLQESGVPALLDPWPDGQAGIAFDPPEDLWTMCREDDGMCSLGGGLALGPEVREAAEKAHLAAAEPYNAMVAKMPPEQLGVGYLIVGVTDYTEPYKLCLSDSSYTPPRTPADPAAEIESELARAEASNRWADCARQNGLPSLKDADPPKADNYETSPVVVLPHDMSKDLLESVVRQCEPFDRQAREKGDDPVDPSFGFDVPGWDGKTKLVTGMVDRETAVHISELFHVLFEPRTRWIMEHAEAGTN